MVAQLILPIPAMCSVHDCYREALAQKLLAKFDFPEGLCKVSRNYSVDSAQREVMALSCGQTFLLFFVLFLKNAYTELQI